jgi:hypothetical protein
VAVLVERLAQLEQHIQHFPCHGLASVAAKSLRIITIIIALSSGSRSGEYLHIEWSCFVVNEIGKRGFFVSVCDELFDPLLHSPVLLRLGHERLVQAPPPFSCRQNRTSKKRNGPHNGRTCGVVVVVVVAVTEAGAALFWRPLGPTVAPPRIVAPLPPRTTTLPPRPRSGNTRLP